MILYPAKNYGLQSQDPGRPYFNPQNPGYSVLPIQIEIQV